MGTLFSSKKDYNPALARQQRTSINISKFEVPEHFQQYPLIGTLSIPNPVRSTEVSTQTSDESPPSESNETLIQSNFPPAIDNQTQQDQPSSPKPLLIRSASFSFQPNCLIHNQIMDDNAMVLSRSVVNLNDQQRLDNNHLSSSRSNRSIVERNGKQFLIELKERMEQRCVQVFDEYIGQMRLFEVTDYIPSRIVRPMRVNPQFPSQNGISRDILPPSLPSNDRPPLPPSIIKKRIEQPVTPSTLVDFKDLHNAETVAREFDLYHSGAALPVVNNNNNDNDTPRINPPPPQPQLTPPDSIDTAYSRSQPQTYNSSSIGSQDARNQYSSGSYRSQTQSFRPHSLTASDYSASTSNINSMSSGSSDSDSEGIDRTLISTNRQNNNNRNNTSVSYGTLGGHNSPIPLDPFAKPQRTSNSYYSLRSRMNNYSEPIVNNRRYQTNTASDYAPIRTAQKQSNRYNYSQRSSSNAYDG